MTNFILILTFLCQSLLFSVDTTPMNTAKLYLDDYRMPVEEGWTLVRDYDEFVCYINKHGVPSEISFDHDLAQEHYNNLMYQGQSAYNKLYRTFKNKTGLECAKYIGMICMREGIPFPKSNVHSQNPAGSANIVDYIQATMLLLGDEDPTVTTESIPYVRQ